MSDRNQSKSEVQTDGSNPVGLTAKQAEVLTAIVALTSRQGFPPTYSEIGNEVGLAKQNIKPIVDRFVYQGLLTRNENDARTILRTAKPYFVKEKKEAVA